MVLLWNQSARRSVDRPNLDPICFVVILRATFQRLCLSVRAVGPALPMLTRRHMKSLLSPTNGPAFGKFLRLSLGGVFLSCGAVRAAITMMLVESGDSVIGSYEGTVNTTGLTFANNFPSGSNISASNAFVGMGTTQSYLFLNGVTGPSRRKNVPGNHPPNPLNPSKLG